MAVHDSCQFNHIADLKFAHHMVAVQFYCTHCDSKLLGDITINCARQYHFGNLQLTGRQAANSGCSDVSLRLGGLPALHFLQGLAYGA